MTEFIAHIYQNNNIFYKHSLDEHLISVAKLAGDFAQKFNCADWAYIAGLWHDIGKYSEEFQAYIRSESGYDAHIENAPGRVNHSSAGALLAIKQFKKQGRIFAYLIAGHHAGLANWTNDGAASLDQRLAEDKQYLLERVLKQPEARQFIEQSFPSSLPPIKNLTLWIRMLFSCLVDADFLDTESFMDADKSISRILNVSLEQLFKILLKHLETFKSQPAYKVNQLRQKILENCLEKASLSPGFFSLTVPTGGGKTLSSLAFALRHAVEHQKQRIIYVIPYTSIIEQTSSIFRGIFGNDIVVEHHSNIDSDNETPRSRLACENWNAPIIVTTAVQFFESLFAARPSKVRKLHNIVNSVVIFDEAQLLPPDYLLPILRMLEELKNTYGVSLVLCTATQPALHARNNFQGLTDIREIMDNPHELQQQFKRVEVILPKDTQVKSTWEALAIELIDHPSVLCIVDKRNDCHELVKLMPEGTIHLSRSMCGEHLSETINEIKQCLTNNEPIRVISTQLVEAGVDIDFPVVYRAMAGLDSLAQAAGRCNREGRLAQGSRIKNLTI